MVSEERRGDIYELTAETPCSGSEGMRVSPSTCILPFPAKAGRKGDSGNLQVDLIQRPPPSPCRPEFRLPFLSGAQSWGTAGAEPFSNPVLDTIPHALCYHGCRSAGETDDPAHVCVTPK